MIHNFYTINGIKNAYPIVESSFCLYLKLQECVMKPLANKVDGMVFERWENGKENF